MSEETRQKVRQLLRPTDEEAGWYRQVQSLDADEAVPILVGILRDEGEEPLTRKIAATILGVLQDERSVEGLAETVERASDPVLRARAAKALGGFEELEESAVQKLVRALEDEDHFVRESSAKALGELRQPAALAALEKMRATDDVSINREVAREAIEAIRGVA